MIKRTIALGLIFGSLLFLYSKKAHADDIYNYLHQDRQQLPQMIAPYHLPPQPVRCSERPDALGHIYGDCSDGTRTTTTLGPFGHSYTTVTGPDGRQHESDCVVTALGTRYCDSNR